jgi:hypothetical protein
MRMTVRRPSHAALRAGIAVLSVMIAAGIARPAFAGPPLLCHPFDIGAARSLPWSVGSAWYEGKPGYDLQRLPEDTRALLTPATPVIVRMETIRRAAIYASHDPSVATRLFATLNEPSTVGAPAGAADPLALFDAGYLTETFREIGRLGSRNVPNHDMHADAVAAMVREADGYALVQRSLALRPADASIDLAAALIAASTPERRSEYARHAEKARAGARQDALLGKNVAQLSN